MSYWRDHTGVRVCALLLQRRLIDNRGKTLYECLCDCGTVVVRKGANLIDAKRKGRITSCGCLHGAAREIHGNYNHPEYASWAAMHARCYNPKNKCFKNYGGRGITVCERWRLFENFLADMGSRPPGLTLERKNNDGNYEPDNCVWATRSEQNRNRRPFSRGRQPFLFV